MSDISVCNSYWTHRIRLKCHSASNIVTLLINLLCANDDNSIHPLEKWCWAVPRYYRGTAVLIFRGTSTVKVTVLPWYCNTTSTAVLPHGAC